MIRDKVVDVTGEELSVRKLLDRIIYRQRHAVTGEFIVNEDLNGFVCWLNHFREGTRLSEKCPKCETFWRYQIKEGILVSVSTGKLVRS